MDDLTTEFLAETNESLGELDNDLLLLEQDPGNSALLSKIFRVMHTIKGTCGFLGMPRLGHVAHATEDLLGLFRDGKKQADSSSVSLILSSLDAIKVIIAGLAQTGKEPDGDDTALIERLHAACSEEATAVVALPLAAAETTQVTTEVSTDNAIGNQFLRVSVDTLEDLITLVSELVLTRNQILQLSRSQKDNSLTTSLQRLNHIVSDLQEGVMKTRMQPIGNAWSKLPRIVRDISRDLGKQIELEMFGQETELDRQVLEMIKDPLTHMIRNAADHGIELPLDRLAAGKPECGKIRLSSFHEGGHIIIEIADDGKGLPLEKIKNKILQNGLATEADIANMSAQDIQQYIFHAGLSTADKITSVSGRGVGMDVVRSNIEKIGGAIEMKSAEGRGSIFTIRIPLTLAIVSALIVGAGDEHFAIPQLDVRELIMISPQSASRIETINGVPFYRLRDRLLPLIDLRGLLKISEDNAQEDRVRYITAIKCGSYNFGLIVDKIFDTEEIVVKPVNSLLRHLPVFSGNTILGDGRVIMILDPSGIVNMTGIGRNPQLEEANDNTDNFETDTMPLLLFQADNSKTIKAVPLYQVSRLEEIDLSRVEYAGGQNVIQYRDSLMPVYQCDDRAIPTTGRRPVIVFSTSGGLAGLVVEKIYDIASCHRNKMEDSNGLSESAIINGRATDIMNLTPPDHRSYLQEAAE